MWVSVCRTLNLLPTCAAGESIPIRLFLAGYEMTPTMRDINKKFSVRYYLNLVLIDEEERRYFKQQVHILHKASCWLGSLSVVLLLTPQEFYSVLGYSDFCLYLFSFNCMYLCADTISVGLTWMPRIFKVSTVENRKILCTSISWARCTGEGMRRPIWPIWEVL